MCRLAKGHELEEGRVLDDASSSNILCKSARALDRAISLSISIRNAKEQCISVDVKSKKHYQGSGVSGLVGRRSLLGMRG